MNNDLLTIFKSKLNEMIKEKFTHNKNNSLIFTFDDQKVGSLLRNFITEVIGFKFNYDNYYEEIAKYFENMLSSIEISDLNSIDNYISKYLDDYSKVLSANNLSNIFIDAMQTKVYDNDKGKVVVLKEDNSILIDKKIISKEADDEKIGKVEMPKLIIKDINNFEKVLAKFVDDVLNGDNNYKRFFNGMEKNEALSYLFEWVIRNATVEDLTDVENYFIKFDNFINDNTFNEFDNGKQIGNLLGDDLYVQRKKANVNYETPFYISFIMGDQDLYIELPNIRYGIDIKDDQKIANILAIQTSQGDNNQELYKKMSDLFKKMLSNKKFFREYNPSHIISLTLALGMFKGLGINKIKVSDYFPLRYNRLVLENQKSSDEIDRLQYNLTNKNINNYMRLCEYFEGLNILNYNDFESGLLIELSDDIYSNNEFLQNLYNIGFNATKQLKHEKEK